MEKRRTRQRVNISFGASSATLELQPRDLEEKNSKEEKTSKEEKPTFWLAQSLGHLSPQPPQQLANCGKL